MATITVQIGNSDDKLTQREWSDFVCEIGKIVKSTMPIHFHGLSPGDAPWQNACWVGVCDDETLIKSLEHRIKNCRGAYKQDSVAVTKGTTEFI